MSDEDQQEALPSTEVPGHITVTVGITIESVPSPGRSDQPRWRPLVALLLSLAGLGDAAYLTLAHYSTTVSLVCSDSGVVNCAKVTTSPQSMIFGVIPVALAGLVFFVALTVVNLPPLWRSARWWVPWLRLGMLVGGMCFVLYLVSAELLVIGNICLWCTGVHIITLLLFIVVISDLPRLMAGGFGPSQGESDR